MTLSGCPADIAIFGGAAGTGKSMSLLMEAARWPIYQGKRVIRDYAGCIFRRDLTDIKGAGGLWEEARRMYEPLGARMREGAEMDATWAESGSKVMFRGLQHVHTVHDYQGYQFAFVGMDELTHFEEYQFWYIISRLRTTCGIRPYLRATTNPDATSWVRRLIDWWIGPDGLPIPERSGVLRWMLRRGDEIIWFDTEAEAKVACVGEHERPMSLTFISAKLTDNRALLSKDPGYGGRLAMMDAVTRARLLDGNWNAVASAGALFSPGWFQVLEQQPDPADVHFMVRGWDIAATKPSAENPDPDWTRGVLMIMLKSSLLVVADMVGHQDSPGATDNLIRATVMQDGPGVVQAFWQDPGSAGVRDVAHLQRTVWEALPSAEVRVETARKDKLSYASPYSARIDPRTRHNQFQISIVRGGWNSAYLSELRAFPSKEAHDDVVDASSRAFMEIESQTIGYAASWGSWMDGVMG
jgi:predicted phage terminase large subunit-like protein